MADEKPVDPINGTQTTTLVADAAQTQYIINGSLVTTGLAIDASGALAGRDFTVNGTLKNNTGLAMRLGDASLVDSDTFIKIADKATFSSGGQGIVAESGGVTFENAGTFTSGATGVILRGDGNAFTNTTNPDKPFGKMTATTGSVLLSYGDDDAITNTGAAIMSSAGDTIISRGARTSITNSGTAQINSTAGSAIVATGSRDVISNIGSLYAMDDVIVSRGSRTKITNDGSISSDTGSGVVSSGYLTTITNTSQLNTGGDGIVSSGDKARIVNTANIGSNNGVGVRSTGDDAIISNSTNLRGKTIGILSTGDDVTIQNKGQIIADNVGIRVLGDHASITTTFSITAGTAISISGNGAVVTIENAIYGSSKTHATIEIDATGETSITNRGAVSASGSGVVIAAGKGSEHILNTGSLYGDVKLGAGDDWFSALKGEVSGKVYGGSGDDVYVVGATVRIREKADGGTDTVQSLYTYTLGANLENLTLIGKGTMDATGNILANRIEGNAGNNHLTGGGGNDVFVFSTGSRQDIIADFSDRHDRIDLSGYDGIDKFSDLAGKIVQSGDDVVITLDGHDRLTIENIHKAHLSAADFLF